MKPLGVRSRLGAVRSRGFQTCLNKLAKKKEKNKSNTQDLSKVYRNEISVIQMSVPKPVLP